MPQTFADRAAAGRTLAGSLGQYAGRSDVIVLGLPRGGVPVAAEVAAALAVDLDVLVVRKLGAPGRPELALGAIASGGVRVLNHDVVSAYRLGPDELGRIAAAESTELARREQAYRGASPGPELAGKSVIVVDDGLATGASMRVAVRAVRAAGPQQVVVAVPVAARATAAALREVADDVVCVLAPENFHAVGQWYDDFRQTTDAEVRELLAARR